MQMHVLTACCITRFAIICAPPWKNIASGCCSFTSACHPLYAQLMLIISVYDQRAHARISGSEHRSSLGRYEVQALLWKRSRLTKCRRCYGGAHELDPTTTLLLVGPTYSNFHENIISSSMYDTTSSGE